ncbi:MAG: AMP-binding protein, partial [Desulfobacteraceae bacterium]|nr:AMP-binding protein [Desulfobacteraceae bacterium]
MDSIYEKRPWLKNYPDGVPQDLEITSDTAINDFRRSAVGRPKAPAVYYFDHVITYGEIDRLSDSLAAAFDAFGIKKGDRIVLDLQNVPQFLVAAYATWKVGAIVVPVNPMYKENELTYFCQDSGAKLFVILSEIASALDLSFLKKTKIKKVVTTSPLDLFPTSMEPPSLLKGIKRKTVSNTVDLLELLEGFRGKSVQDPALSPDDVAYLTYTSG